MRIFEVSHLSVFKFIVIFCKSVNSERSVQTKFFYHIKMLIWKIFQHKSCRELDEELTVKFWIIFVKWFGRYGQITRSLENLFSGLTSLQNLEDFTLIGSELSLAMTRWNVPHYPRHLLEKFVNFWIAIH